MADYDDQIAILKERAALAAARAGDMDEGVWPDESSRERLQKVLAYMRLVLENTDAALVAPALIPQLDESLAQFIDSPAVVYQEFASWLGTIFERLARLPAARGRDFEQTAKDAAVTFQRSARGRLSALEGELRSTRDQAAEIRTQIEQSSADAAAQSNARLDELRQAVDSLDARMQERLEGFESSLESDKEERLRQRREQAEAFESAEAQRIEAANVRQAELEQEWRERADGVVVPLEASAQRAEELVDLVATSSTAGAFSREAREQKDQADAWRRYAVWLGLGAALVALIAVVYAVAVEVNTSIIVAKLALTVVFVGLAGYAAKQSSEHRNREIRARRLDLQLTSFGPFTEGLKDPAKEQDARAKLIDNIYVGDPGPTPESAGDAPALTSGQITLVGQLFDQAKKLLK